MRRDYTRSLSTKADEVEGSVRSWQSGNAEARPELIDQIHRLISAGSFGFVTISDSATSIEHALVDGASLADVQSDLDAFIAQIRAKGATEP